MGSAEDGKEVLQLFAEYLNCEDIKKVYHNFCFDAAMFRSHIEGHWEPKFYADTLHMSKLINCSQLAGHGLDDLSKRYKLKNKKERSFEKEFGKGSNIRDLQIYENQKFIEYSVRDATVTLELFFKLRAKLKEEEWTNGEVSKDSQHLWSFYKAYYQQYGQALH